MPIHEGPRGSPRMRLHAWLGSVRSASPRRYELCSDLQSADDDCQFLYLL